MERHDRPMGDRLAPSTTDLLEVQRTLVALGAPRHLVVVRPAPPTAADGCDETLAMRLARCLRLVKRLAP